MAASKSYSRANSKMKEKIMYNENSKKPRYHAKFFPHKSLHQKKQEQNSIKQTNVQSIV
jgi:hypothetical protein